MFSVFLFCLFLVLFFIFLIPGKMIQVVCESPVETVKSEEVESPLQTAELSEERGTPPAPADTKGRREGRPRRTSLMALLRQVVSRFLWAGGTAGSVSEDKRRCQGGCEMRFQVTSTGQGWNMMNCAPRDASCPQDSGTERVSADYPYSQPLCNAGSIPCH